MNQASTRSRVTQPSQHIFLHICTVPTEYWRMTSGIGPAHCLIMEIIHLQQFNAQVRKREIFFAVSFKRCMPCPSRPLVSGPDRRRVRDTTMAALKSPLSRQTGKEKISKLLYMYCHCSHAFYIMPQPSVSCHCNRIPGRVGMAYLKVEIEKHVLSLR